MNFGCIFEAFSVNCVELIVEGNEFEAKTRIRNFLRKVKNNPILHSQFKIYSSIKESYFKDREVASRFLDSMLELAESLGSPEDIRTANRLFAVSFGLKLRKPSKLQHALAILIESKTDEDLRKHVATYKSYELVLNELTTPKADRKLLTDELKSSGLFENCDLQFLQPKHVIRLAIKDFNANFSKIFTPAEKDLFRTLRECSDTDLEALYLSKCSMLASLTDELSERQDVDSHLSKTLIEAKDKVCAGYNLDNLLDAIDLTAELEKLCEE